MQDFQVVWRGPLLGATGYGKASREYVDALVKQRVDVKLKRGRGAICLNLPLWHIDLKKEKGYLWAACRKGMLLKRKVAWLLTMQRFQTMITPCIFSSL